MAESKSSGKDYSTGTPGIKATNSLKAGDIIVPDKHLVHVVSHRVKRVFCDNCYKKLLVTFYLCVYHFSDHFPAPSPQDITENKVPTANPSTTVTANANWKTGIHSTNTMSANSI
jgi:hypothetical protein